VYIKIYKYVLPESDGPKALVGALVVEVVVISCRRRRRGKIDDHHILSLQKLFRRYK